MISASHDAVAFVDVSFVPFELFSPAASAAAASVALSLSAHRFSRVALKVRTHPLHAPYACVASEIVEFSVYYA